VPEEAQPSKGDESPQARLPAPHKQLPPKLAADIQAILTVLGRRTWTTGVGENQRLRKGEEYSLNLENMDLRAVSLLKANLERPSLVGAHLERASLIDTNLKEARLSGAHLNGAELSADPNNSEFQSAYLDEAHLNETDLDGASVTIE
jgi:uncharacterized protein YjbI with pentapeptide repeats